MCALRPRGAGLEALWCSAGEQWYGGRVTKFVRRSDKERQSRVAGGVAGVHRRSGVAWGAGEVPHRHSPEGRAFAGCGFRGWGQKGAVWSYTDLFGTEVAG